MAGRSGRRPTAPAAWATFRRRVRGVRGRDGPQRRRSANARPHDVSQPASALTDPTAGSRRPRASSGPMRASHASSTTRFAPSRPGSRSRRDIAPLGLRCADGPAEALASPLQGRADGEPGRDRDGAPSSWRGVLRPRSPPGSSMTRDESPSPHGPSFPVGMATPALPSTPTAAANCTPSRDTSRVIGPAVPRPPSRPVESEMAIPAPRVGGSAFARPKTACERAGSGPTLIPSPRPRPVSGTGRMDGRCGTEELRRGHRPR